MCSSREQQLTEVCSRPPREQHMTVPAHGNKASLTKTSFITRAYPVKNNVDEIKKNRMRWKHPVYQARLPGIYPRSRNAKLGTAFACDIMEIPACINTLFFVNSALSAAMSLS